MSTQFDTRVNRELLKSTPLSVFSPAQGRVDVLIDGRLIDSRSLSTGTNALDTSSFPDGSYSVSLKIHGLDGSEREETHLFSKSAQIVPVGEISYSIYAGALTDNHGHGVFGRPSSAFFQASGAKRLTKSVALDVKGLLAGQKPIFEIGGWFIGRLATTRIAGLASLSGDTGLLVQSTSSAESRLKFSFDLRRLWLSHHGPLLPFRYSSNNFDSPSSSLGDSRSGSYTLFTGNAGYPMGSAYLGLAGSWRRDSSRNRDYSLGPNVLVPFTIGGRLQVIANADARWGRHEKSAFLGIRIQMTKGEFSTVASAGLAGTSSRRFDGRGELSPVGDFIANWNRQLPDRTQVSAHAGISRSSSATSVLAGGEVLSAFGGARGELSHSIDGLSGTNYAVSVQTGLAIAGNKIVVGGRDLNESALLIDVAAPSNLLFDVIVDDRQRARVHGGSSTPIFLEPYRSYDVRLKPVTPAALAYDAEPRRITLYRGNAKIVRWNVTPLATVFGQLVSSAGEPIPNADMRTAWSFAQTDDQGYFQMDVALRDKIAVTFGGSSCKAFVAADANGEDFVRIGKVTCA